MVVAPAVNASIARSELEIPPQALIIIEGPNVLRSSLTLLIIEGKMGSPLSPPLPVLSLFS